MSGATARQVPLERIHVHPTNVRRDLGDLRDLTDSIRQWGILIPVTLERRGSQWRLRDGARRLAAAKILGLRTLPALTHDDALEDDEWLTQAVHVNHRRRDLDRADKAHTITQMRAAGMTWDGIARTFDTTPARVRRWVEPDPAPAPRRPRVPGAALGRLAAAWRTQLDAGHATTDQLLDALEALAADGRVDDHYPEATDPDQATPTLRRAS